MHEAHCRNLLRGSLGLVLLLTSSLITAQPLLPFSASYAADMKKIPVNGEASHSLSANADGSWTLTFSAGMFVARLTEQSTLRLQDDQLLPLNYRYERRGLGRSRVTTQEFDWSQGEVRGKHKDKDFSLPTEPGLLDKTTYQLALQRDLMAGKQEMHYRVVEGDDIDDYHFRVVGERQVSTQAGRFDAVEVERVREPDAKRHTTLWFAKEHQYLLVRLSQVETDGQHYQIMLEEAQINGEPVVGNAN